MALQSSGAISLANINTEFNFSAGATRSMGQLYRNGGIVPDASVNVGIPTSGTISLSQFYGATRRIPITITISANQTNYVLNTAKAAGYVSGIMDVTLVINSGVYISASSTGVYALDVDTSWAAGDTLTITNNGYIIGMGGRGGDAGGGSSYAGAGAAGGPALRVQRSIYCNNNNTIGGGGGGGGGGAGGWTYVNENNEAYGGGSGGGGRSNLYSNSSAGAGTYSGGPGTYLSPGAGGISEYQNGYTGSNGGAGGGWGASGAAASGLNPLNGPAGGGGVAVAGNSNITWLVSGTRLGALT